MNSDRINDLFTYNNPQGIDPHRFTIIIESAKILAEAINENGGIEEEIERSILKLHECIFYAIASIVLPEQK